MGLGMFAYFHHFPERLAANIEGDQVLPYYIISVLPKGISGLLITAIFAASMGLVMNDIKRVLAYSTISQLGYMMLGLGTGGIAIGIFHLFNHAFFKALLFLFN